MIDAQAYKKIIEDSQRNLTALMEAQDKIFEQLSVHKPELFEMMVADMERIRSAKDVAVVNEIIQKYASYSDNQGV
jgi:hypothetical protein